MRCSRSWINDGTRLNDTSSSRSDVMNLPSSCDTEAQTRQVSVRDAYAPLSSSQRGRDSPHRLRQRLQPVHGRVQGQQVAQSANLRWQCRHSIPTHGEHAQCGQVADSAWKLGEVLQSTQQGALSKASSVDWRLVATRLRLRCSPRSASLACGGRRSRRVGSASCSAPGSACEPCRATSSTHGCDQWQGVAEQPPRWQERGLFMQQSLTR